MGEEAGEMMTLEVGEYSRMQQELIQLKQVKYESQEREKMLTQELQSLKKLAGSQDKELSKAKKELTKLQGTFAKSKEKQAVASLTEQNVVLQRQVDELNKQSVDTMKALTKATQQAESQEAVIASLKDQLKQAKIAQKLDGAAMGNGDEGALKGLAEQNSALEIQVGELQHTIAELQQSVQTATAEAKKLRETLQQKQTLLDHVQNTLAQQDEQAREAVAFLKQQLRERDDKLEKLNKKHEQVQEEVAELKRREAAAAQERGASLRNVQSAIESEKEIGQRCARLEKEKKELENHLEANQNELKHLREDIAAARIQQHNTQTALFRASQDIEAKQRELGQLRTKMDNKNSELEDLKEKMKVMEGHSMQDVVRELQMQLRDTSETEAAMRLKCTAMQEEIQRLTSELGSKSDKSKEDVATLEGRLEQSQQLVKRLESEKGALGKEVEDLKAVVKERDQLRTELAEAREHLKALDEAVEQVDQAQQERDEAKRELAELQAGLDDRMAEQGILVKRQGHLVKELKQELRKLTGELNDTKHERDEAQRKAQAVKQQLDAQMARAKQAPTPSRVGQHGGEEDVGLRDKLVETQAANINLTERVALLEESVQNLTGELNQKDEVIKDMLRKGRTYIPREEQAEPIGNYTPFTPNKRGGDLKADGAALFRSVSDKLMPRAQRTNAHDAEKQKRMEGLMEELLHKNINLQGALDTLGKEMDGLREENAELKERHEFLKQQLQ